MAHFKRNGPKSTRAGCLLCKPQKRQGTPLDTRQRFAQTRRIKAADAAIAEARCPGSLRGKLVVGPAFFEPLPDDELDAWERFLEQDLAAYPERVRQLPASLVRHARALTAGMEVDLDARLPDDDE